MMITTRRGFTVVELVVVIAIIGLLIVLVPPAGLGVESWTMCYPPNGPGGRTTSGATATSPPGAPPGNWP